MTEHKCGSCGKPLTVDSPPCDCRKARRVLDVVTDRVLSYRPKDKGEWAKKTERRVKRQRKAKGDE